jgi:hypothetical protein
MSRPKGIKKSPMTILLTDENLSRYWEAANRLNVCMSKLIEESLNEKIEKLELEYAK